MQIRSEVNTCPRWFGFYPGQLYIGLNNLRRPNISKKFPAAPSAQPYCLLFQIFKSHLGAKIGNLKGQWALLSLPQGLPQKLYSNFFCKKIAFQDFRKFSNLDTFGCVWIVQSFLYRNTSRLKRKFNTKSGNKIATISFSYVELPFSSFTWVKITSPIQGL